MDAPQDVLLPILLATIVANAIIIVLLLASGRIGRNKRVAAAGNAMPSFEPSMLSTSYRERTAGSAWPPVATASLANGVDGADRAEADGAEVDKAADANDPYPADGVEDAEDLDPADASLDLDSDTRSLLLEPIPGADGSDAAGVVGAPVPEAGLDDVLDPLTGLPDGSVFSRLVADEDARIARYHHPATVVIFELEGFERFVDRLGSDAGDRVIPAVAGTIRRLARAADHVARLGPGRFAVLMAETDEIAAINYIERVRSACELWLESGAIALRLAVGWAGTTGEPALGQTQRIAMDRMYVELRRHARRTANATDPARPGDDAGRAS
jgi:diguanylate cyclase (GGDEF)-like protein